MVREIPADISAEMFDVVVIGAGINGAGVARDAAMRGLRVLLLEKGDVASGTSAWSTRLIHGGLRYLEHGEVGLVRESLRERERLFRVAPHLVRPLSMLIPIYAEARRGLVKVRAGMLAYDLLSFDKSVARHRMLSRAETVERAPGLAVEGLRGAAIYFDAQVEFAERLVLENVLAAREAGALVLTYARVERMLFEKDAVWRVEFADVLGGGETYAARARLVVNVAGPWVDEVLRRGGVEGSPRLVGGTKGSHIVVEAFASAPRDALYVEARGDGRPFFIIPWNGRYLIGTTDTRYGGDLDGVTADEGEIEYLLKEANRVLPRAKLRREDVRLTYSGVRPLAYAGGRSEASLTRRHFVHDHAPALQGFVSVVGGKLTTYRNLSEQTVDLLFRKLGRRAPACETARVPLPGARVADFRSFRAQFMRDTTLPAAVAERLLRIYGTRAREVEELASSSPDLREILSAETHAIGAEVVHAFRQELAETLSDCLWRRTMVGLSVQGAALPEADAAANLARKHLGWDDARAARELAAYREYVARFHPRRSDGG